MEAISDLNVLVPLGGAWCIEVRADTTPTVTVTLPDDSTATPDVTAHGWCTYRAVYTVATGGDEGRYVAHVATDTDAVDLVAYALGATTDSGMPTSSDLATYLNSVGSGQSWSTAVLADALAVEAAAQRAVCVVPAAFPDDLRGALLRRAQRNLAMRTLPLAIQQGDAEVGVTMAPPGTDPEVRRLERPYRRLLIG